MTAFVMKGHPGHKYHGAHSAKPLSIQGHFICQGPQVVCKGGVPEWVHQAFEANPHITQIAANAGGGGAVWSRYSEHASQEPK